MQAARLTQELRQMHTELGTVTGRLAAAEARLAHTQSHDTVVARNHQLEVRENAAPAGKLVPALSSPFGPFIPSVDHAHLFYLALFSQSKSTYTLYHTHYVSPYSTSL